MRRLRQGFILACGLIGVLVGMASSLASVLSAGALTSSGSGLVGLFYPLALVLGAIGWRIGIKQSKALLTQKSDSV